MMIWTTSLNKETEQEQFLRLKKKTSEQSVKEHTSTSVR